LCAPISRAKPQEKQSLRLERAIPMSNVKGRIDHMDMDVKGKRLFVAGLESGSLEVVDLAAGVWSKRIPGFKKTQGVAYIPSLNKLFVASGDDGMLRVFRGVVWNYLIRSSWNLGRTGLRTTLTEAFFT
jgi:hypothetical protein